MFAGVRPKSSGCSQMERQILSTSLTAVVEAMPLNVKLIHSFPIPARRCREGRALGKPHGCARPLQGGGPSVLAQVLRENVAHGGDQMAASNSPESRRSIQSSWAAFASRSWPEPPTMMSTRWRDAKWRRIGLVARRAGSAVQPVCHEEKMVFGANIL